MTRLRTVLADDESWARIGIRRLLQSEPDVCIVAECADGPATIEAVRAHRPNLLLLDIEMPGCNGFDALRSLGPNAPATVLLTAFNQYGPQAFECGVVDYVQKPIEPDRFARALARVRVHRPQAASPGQHTSRIAVRTRSGFELVAVEAIETIEAADNYVELCTATRRHLLATTLAALEDSLPSNLLRIHRGRMVNLNHVARLRRKLSGDYEVHLRSGRIVPAGRSYRTRLLALLSNPKGR